MSQRVHQWNADQKYTANFVRIAQETVGLEPDCAGKWRAGDTDAIKAFQSKRKLQPDGKVGVATARAIRGASGIFKRAELEFWWDNGPVERVGILAQNQVKRIAIMVNRSSRLYQFTPSWKLRNDSLRRITDAARCKGMGVTLTAWVRPNKANITAVRDYLDHAIKLTGATGIEVELEGNWSTSNLWADDFNTLGEAGAFLIGMLDDLARTHGVTIEGTTFPGHAELDASKATVMQRVQIAWPQVYAVVKPKGNPRYEWGGDFSPGHYQAYYLPQFKAQWPELPVVCGLAGYGQVFHAHDPVDAIARSECEAIQQGSTRNRIWSVRHMVPGGYLAEWLAGRLDE